ncbi:hypothetical protein O9993_07310 [Vibrio lentus]|nr:hypothetical protein [Vibrio lentus]
MLDNARKSRSGLVRLIREISDQQLARDESDGFESRWFLSTLNVGIDEQTLALAAGAGDIAENGETIVSTLDEAVKTVVWW